MDGTVTAYHPFVSAPAIEICSPVPPATEEACIIHGPANASPFPSDNVLLSALTPHPVATTAAVTPTPAKNPRRVIEKSGERSSIINAPFQNPFRHSVIQV